MKCSNCDAENIERTHDNPHVPYMPLNFCRQCGVKLVETCECWIKDKPYNCGHSKCPGYGLMVEECKNQILGE